MIGACADDRSPKLRAYLTRGLTVFVFHEVTDTPSEFQYGSRGYVSSQVLRRQIKWIGERFEFIAPTELARLGGTGMLPARAALVTFDDAWEGVFSLGIPLLESLGIPALCFLNMATVAGAPDLAAVRRYERLHPPREGPRLDRGVSANTAEDVLREIIETYADDPDYARFQGHTATAEHLAAAASSSSAVWFGSHLFHHWDMRRIGVEVLAESVRANARALAAYRNSLPALATPFGVRRDIDAALFEELEISVVFTATGGQNQDESAYLIDRLALAPEPSTSAEWWYSTHRRKLFGSLAS
jgi:peptidoglycan/xylan/chitin deacetylase (PgdA/CDA1 family)